MTYKKPLIPREIIKKLLEKRKNPRIDNEEPQNDHEDGSGFLSEMRQLDHLADESLKSRAPTNN